MKAIQVHQFGGPEVQSPDGGPRGLCAKGPELRHQVSAAGPRRASTRPGSLATRICTFRRRGHRDRWSGAREHAGWTAGDKEGAWR